MPRYFVTDPPVPIYEFDPTEVISATPPNIIWIRSKMDIATDAKVKSELLRFGKDSQIEAHIGENELSLLIHNIVKWEGPDLGTVPCTPEQIRKLDPTEPHLRAVLAAIAERNQRAAGPSPKSAAASTFASAGAVDSNGSATP